MAWQCQASLPGSRHMATPTRSTYLASAATWQQKHWSCTLRRNLKYCTFLFVGMTEISTVLVLSSIQNEAHTGCWLKPEILTWEPVPQISAFSLRRKCGWEYSDRNAEKSPHSYMEKMRKKMWRKCGENADGSIRAGTRRNLRILIWKKCGGNAEKMRMGVFGQECGEISALYPHFSHNTEITRRTSPHSQFSAPQP